MLRVVSGKWKGRKLAEVDRVMTRPTTDRNKETLFNVLGQYFHGGSALDLFAGSGSLGIEAVSRGMDRAFFVDSSIDACRTIRGNLTMLGANDQCQVVNQDWKVYLGRIEIQFDLIIADPPYAFADIDLILNLIDEQMLLKPGGALVVETHKVALLPNKVGKLEKIREVISGIAKFTIYNHEGESL
ncbi:MAG: 16S rRNA (guanine(966)-N(2))-methyltransferase RsmD [Bacilli bacterium]|nr:16S rRNA (guanine(966)-N(2))-methyltransferase RsmD [Bacilli bacterium]MBN2696720.1 16S rRNA (guanine(966)-N(2))-methyltransferase RsmD [Bacilli bacterium]